MAASQLATLLGVSTIVTLAFAVTLLAAARGLGDAGHGTGWWVAGDVVIALARSLVLLEGFPVGGDGALSGWIEQRPLAIPAGLFLAAMWLHWSALRRANGRRVLPLAVAALVLIAFVGGWMAVSQALDDAGLRMRLFLALVAAGASFTLWTSWPLLRESWGGLLIAAPLVASILFNLPQVLTASSPGSSPLPGSMLFIVDLIVSIFMATGFMVLLQERLRQRIAQLSVTDALTGARNRHGLTPIVTHEIAKARRSRQALSLVLFDLDHFKQINDRFGHDVGDAVLKGFARCVMETVRSGDAFGRWGGEEFALLLPETSLDTAAQLAERIRLKVAAGPLETGLPIVTISAGVAQFDAQGAPMPDTLFKRADLRLYEAKRRRNTVDASFEPAQGDRRLESG